MSEGKINSNFKLKDKGISNAVDTRNLPRHRWYFYKEGFSPSLVKKAIDDVGLEKNDLVIDPFNGSGTVTLTCGMQGINSLGYEVNPFTSFLSKIKGMNANVSDLSANVEQVLKKIKRGRKSDLENFSTFSKKVNDKKWLFNKSVLRAFEGGYSAVKSERTNSSKLIKLALLSAAMKNCNAKKDGKCLRYKNNWTELDFNDESFINSFIEQIDVVKEDLNEKVLVKPTLINGDVRKLVKKMDDKFKLCITSPPYVNTFDYTDIYRPELFLGQFVTGYDELYKLRLKTVRSHIQARWKKPSEESYGFIFDDVYNKIKSKPELLMHKNIPIMILAYFEDMKQILFDLKQKAEKGANLWFVVSTSAYANYELPVDLILADIAVQVGWKLKEIGVLRDIPKRKTKYSPDIDKLRESVVILSN